MLQQRVAFPAHIESIETVVPGVKIAGVEKERLEGSPHRFARSGNRLHDHDPGSETMPVPASQHHRLVTLDVDFHEMDLALGDVLLAQCSQRSGLGLEGSRCDPVTACLDLHVRSRKRALQAAVRTNARPTRRHALIPDQTPEQAKSTRQATAKTEDPSASRNISKRTARTPQHRQSNGPETPDPRADRPRK